MGLLLQKWHLNPTYFSGLFTPHRLLILYGQIFYLGWTVLAIVFYCVYLPVQHFGNLGDDLKLWFHNKFNWIGITTASAHPAGHSHLLFNQLVEVKHNLKQGNTVKSSLNWTQNTHVISFQINFWYIYDKSLQISFQPNKPHSVGDLINKNLLTSAWEHLEQRGTWRIFFFFTQMNVVTFKRFVKQ